MMHHMQRAEPLRPPQQFQQQFQQQQHAYAPQHGGHAVVSSAMHTIAALPMAPPMANGEHPAAPPRSALRNKRPRGATDLRVGAGGAPAPAPISAHSTGSNASNASHGSNGAGTHPYPPPIEAELSNNIDGEQLQRYKAQLSPTVSYDLGVSNDAMLDFLTDTPTREAAHPFLTASGTAPPMSATPPLSAQSPAHKRLAGGGWPEDASLARDVLLDQQVAK